MRSLRSGPSPQKTAAYRRYEMTLLKALKTEHEMGTALRVNTLDVEDGKGRKNLFIKGERYEAAKKGHTQRP